MNSVQLSQRLARNLALNDGSGSILDPFNIPADVALDVLSAINGGLQTLYREMPNIYKRTTLSQTLRSPQTLSVTFQDKYSNVVGEDTFTLSMFGCTLRLDNGTRDTEVTGPNSVLDDYLGDNLTSGATLYSDVVPMQDVIERIIGAVRIYDNTQAEPTALVRDERLRGGRARRWGWMGEWDEVYYPYDAAYLSAIGRPRYYYLDPAGASEGFELAFLLRVAPMPDQDYTVRMEAELSTERIIFADLTIAREIFVRDALVDDILIPLCEAELILSRFWADPQLRNVVKDRQQMVLSTKMPKIPRDVAPSCNGIGRPVGY